jgi:hypothetical protein
MFLKSALAVFLMLACVAQGQELSPRAYWPAPKGTEILLLAYTYQTGDIISDPSLPVEGAESTGGVWLFGYQRTLDLFGRTSNLQVVLPVSSVTASAEIDGELARRDVSGQGDLSATLSVNLMGAPSFSVEEFQAFRADPKPILAAGIKVVAPTGQYDDDRLINVGNNRWATRFRLGYIHPLGNNWILEMAAARWFYEDNPDFVNGYRQQHPLTAIDASIIKRISPGFWASLDATHYYGGDTMVDGLPSFDFQRNSRVGFSIAYPFARRHLLKFSYTDDLEAKAAGNFNTAMLSYAYRL